MHLPTDGRERREIVHPIGLYPRQTVAADHLKQIFVFEIFIGRHDLISITGNNCDRHANVGVVFSQFR